MIESTEDQIDLMNAALGIMLDYQFDPERIMAIGAMPGDWTYNSGRIMR